MLPCLLAVPASVGLCLAGVAVDSRALGASRQPPQQEAQQAGLPVIHTPPACPLLPRAQKPLLHGLPAAKARCFHLLYNLSVHGELLYPSAAEAAEASVLEAGEALQRANKNTQCGSWGLPSGGALAAAGAYLQRPHIAAAGAHCGSGGPPSAGAHCGSWGLPCAGEEEGRRRVRGCCLQGAAGQ